MTIAGTSHQWVVIHTYMRPWVNTVAKTKLPLSRRKKFHSFSCMEKFIICFKFHWTFLPGFQWTTILNELKHYSEKLHSTFSMDILTYYPNFIPSGKATIARSLGSQLTKQWPILVMQIILIKNSVTIQIYTSGHSIISMKMITSMSYVLNTKHFISMKRHPIALQQSIIFI